MTGNRLQDGAEEYIGVIGRTHGIDGTVVLTDIPGTTVTLSAGTTVFVGFSREHSRPLTVRSFIPHLTSPRISFTEFLSAETASALIDHAVYVPSVAVQVTGDRYSIGDIEGCTVYDEDGTELGTVSEVWLLPANDVWVVSRTDGTTIPLPVIDDVIRSVDTAQRRIVVRLLPGLADLTSSETGTEDGDE